MNKYKKIISELISETKITLNGNNSQDPQILNKKFYKRVLTQGSLGLGESYMEGWWTCERLDLFLYELFCGEIENKVRSNTQLKLLILKSKLFNQQSKSKSLKAISNHYDIGNDLYEKMLDPLMMYSCGFWADAENLTQAQENKLELICQKLKLKPGEKVLDIGCGWGGFAYYAAKNYQVEVVGITISDEQKKLAEKRCENLPIEIRFQDYRDLNEKFDKICSIGMLEHVGHKNYQEYFGIVQKCLKREGLALIHFIGGNETSYHTDPWIDKYIFPQGLIPSIKQIGKAMENKLVLQDWHNFGPYYDTTLMAWLENFNENWNLLKDKYDDIFYKMWEFYLCSSAASFRSNRLSLWQIVITNKEYKGLYKSVRPMSFIKEELQTDYILK